MYTAHTKSRQLLPAISNWTAGLGVVMTSRLSAGWRQSKIAPAMAILEPILIIFLIVLLHRFLRYSGLAPVAGPSYGLSSLVFIGAGILPYWLFFRISVRSRPRAMHRRLGRMTVFDMYLATAIMMSSVSFFLIIIWFGGLYLWGIEEARPRSLPDLWAAMILLVMCGYGVGLINGVINSYVPRWYHWYRRFGRVALLLSASHYIMDLVQLPVRTWITWNPMAHGVEWFRVGIYGTYPSMTLDRWYLITCAFGLILVGLVMERATLRSRVRA